MIFTVEPMINAGRPDIRQLADGWTIVTKDHSLSAQWEHTVLVTDNGYEVLDGLSRRAPGAVPTNLYATTVTAVAARERRRVRCRSDWKQPPSGAASRARLKATFLSTRPTELLRHLRAASSTHTCATVWTVLRRCRPTRRSSQSAVTVAVSFIRTPTSTYSCSFRVQRRRS